MSSPNPHTRQFCRRYLLRIGAAATALFAVVGLSACKGPQSSLDPASSGAGSIAQLWWVMFWGAGIITLITVGITLYAVLRPSSHRIPVSPGSVVIVGGLIWPLTVLVALLIYSVPRGHTLLALPTERDVLEVHVTGHQWWWEVSYPDVDGSPLYTANEIHIPAGRPVDVVIRGADVIHSFWVPRLAGKLDALPGTTNVVRIEAEHPGEFRGQCAEFCGLQHARMAMLVIAHTPEEFDNQLQRLDRMPRGDGALTAPGREAFVQFCASCHSANPRERGDAAPNLANVADRRWLGAGTLENRDGALLDWLNNHQTYKPGNRMPSHAQLDQQTLEAIAAFLEDAQ